MESIQEEDGEKGNTRKTLRLEQTLVCTVMDVINSVIQVVG